MTNYAQIARKNWQMLAPNAYSQMSQEMNLEEYFLQIQEQADLMVQDLTDQYAGTDMPTESYLQKVGRLQAAKKRAEETVYHQLLTPPEELWEEEAMSQEEIQSELIWIKNNLEESLIFHQLTPSLMEGREEGEIQVSQQAYNLAAAPLLKRQQELQQMLAH
ncbi:TnpV protein [Rothia sp. (in: high G+C Gram-positive bacteria)]|uniref:TnpV protein n=1 Tax=Rothia sp. (in: high G+C Gram-positive bacteria) TaxID=1885016 RepID=UPI0032163A90